MVSRMDTFSFDLVCIRPYFRRRSGDLEGIFVASFVGVVSGIYIFKPLLEEMAVNRSERERREALEAAAASNENKK
jgi:hypothetical protein